MAEDYVNLVGDMMYPKVGFGAYGYETGKVRGWGSLLGAGGDATRTSD
jgi:hypothetical protein